MIKRKPTSEPQRRSALVLLSGGLDSVAALHWSLAQYDDVRAVSFYYGQPQARAEVAAAQAIAARRNVPWASIHLGEAVRGPMRTLCPAEPGRDHGISRANLPARNAIFLSVAAAYAASIWPWKSLAIPTAIVIGCNHDDAAAFPDCRYPFLDAMQGAAMSALCGVADVRVVAPWLHIRKGAIVRWAVEAGSVALADVLDSMSCYAGTHCGACDACTLRAQAIASEELSDHRWIAPFSGGDPHRDSAG